MSRKEMTWREALSDLLAEYESRHGVDRVAAFYRGYLGIEISAGMVRDRWNEGVVAGIGKDNPYALRNSEYVRKGSV